MKGNNFSLLSTLLAICFTIVISKRFLNENEENNINNQDNQLYNEEDKAKIQVLSVTEILSLLEKRVSEDDFVEISEAFETISNYVPYHIKQKIDNINSLKLKKKSLENDRNIEINLIKLHMFENLEYKLTATLLNNLVNEIPKIFKDSIEKKIKINPNRVKEAEELLKIKGKLKNAVLILFD